MNISDLIQRVFPRRASVLVDSTAQGIFGSWLAERKDFAGLIWHNLCGLLFDLAEDVKIELDAVQKADQDKVYKFAAFRAFFYAWGRVVLQKLVDEGFCVIGWNGTRLWLMNSNEYSTPSEGTVTFVKPYADGVEAYVMRSPEYIMRGSSLLSRCRPWLDFLDDVCNGSATASKRLGAVVIGSPKTYSGAPMPTILTDEQKKKLEDEYQNTYGSLDRQRQFMLFTKEMGFQVISLAGVDQKFETKLRQCVLALADALPVPANQVALIDANSSKALSNGSELREGDKAKYKSFRRHFERSFVQLSMDMGLKISYSIDGEPIDKEVVAEGT